MSYAGVKESGMTAAASASQLTTGLGQQPNASISSTRPIATVLPMGAISHSLSTSVAPSKSFQRPAATCLPSGSSGPCGPCGPSVGASSVCASAMGARAGQAVCASLRYASISEQEDQNAPELEQVEDWSGGSGRAAWGATGNGQPSGATGQPIGKGARQVAAVGPIGPVTSAAGQSSKASAQSECFVVKGMQGLHEQMTRPPIGQEGAAMGPAPFQGGSAGPIAPAFPRSTQGPSAFSGGSQGPSAFPGASQGLPAFVGGSQGPQALPVGSQGQQAYPGASQGPPAFQGASRGSNAPAFGGLFGAQQEVDGMNRNFEYMTVHDPEWSHLFDASKLDAPHMSLFDMHHEVSGFGGDAMSGVAGFSADSPGASFSLDLHNQWGPLRREENASLWPEDLPDWGFGNASRATSSRPQSELGPLGAFANDHPGAPFATSEHAGAPFAANEDLVAPFAGSEHSGAPFAANDLANADTALIYVYGNLPEDVEVSRSYDVMRSTSQATLAMSSVSAMSSMASWVQGRTSFGGGLGTSLRPPCTVVSFRSRACCRSHRAIHKLVPLHPVICLICPIWPCQIWLVWRAMWAIWVVWVAG